MPSTAESRTPESLLRTEKLSDFTQITEELRRENPELFNDVKAVLHLTAELERSDLPADRLQYLEDERHELVAQLLEHPEESVMAEVDLLARSYKGRTMTGVDYEGIKTTQFVTRDPERMKADLHFRVTEFPSGHSRIRIEVPLRDERYELPEPFFLILDTDNGLTIEQRVYERGEYRYKAVDPASDRGRDKLWRFFTYSITATDLLDNRPLDEQQQADAQAKAMLRHKILHG